MGKKVAGQRANEKKKQETAKKDKLARERAVVKQAIEKPLMAEVRKWRNADGSFTAANNKRR